MASALFTDSAPEMRIDQEEIFGPVAAVIRVRDYEEAVAMANADPFGLSAGIVTTSLKYSSYFKRNSESGLMMVNLPTASLDYHVPFAGRTQGRFTAGLRKASAQRGLIVRLERQWGVELVARMEIVANELLQ